MIAERRVTIRAALQNDTQKPFMEIILTPWLCFARVRLGKQIKTIPGASLASAQLNGLAFLRSSKPRFALH
jgi:hypothetical protein